jgi:hypothetical protein
MRLSSTKCLVIAIDISPKFLSILRKMKMSVTKRSNKQTKSTKQRQKYVKIIYKSAILSD